MGYIDFHTHILFDVDHGVQEFEKSVELLKVYKENGFDTVVLTPHIYHPQVNCKVQNIKANFLKLREEAEKIGIKVLLGSELYLEAQTEVKSIPVAGKFALVEFPPMSKPLDLEGKLSQLIEQDLQPVIAHVERYKWLKPTSEEMKMLLRLGCLITVNVGGIEDHSAEPYIKQGYVDLIASDNHGDETLPGRLKKILENNEKISQNMSIISRECM